MQIHYYEAHINFVGKLTNPFQNWKEATFEMHKDRKPTKFITGRHGNKDVLLGQTRFLAESLGTACLRWKIEATLLDSNYGDTFYESTTNTRPSSASV